MAGVPGAPVDFNVTLKPTAATLSWKPPTTGRLPTGYEISYREGTAPGGMWIPTGSRSGRFALAGLKRGTQYTFRVRGINTEGNGHVSVIRGRTPIAEKHNILFFKECVNYIGGGDRVSVHGDAAVVVRAAADNDYNTFTTERDLVVDMAVNGSPTRVDAVFIKGKDILRHSATPQGGTGSGYNNRTMPATVRNWEGTEVSTNVYGFQHDLHLLPVPWTATSVRMQFTGNGAKIYAVMLLEFGLEVDANGDLTEIETDMVDRANVVHQTPGGRLSRSRAIGNERPKWETNYVVKVVPGKTALRSVEELLYWRAENPNLVHAQEPSRYPARVYPASFLMDRVPVRLRTENKLDGESVNIRIAEQ